ncbi:MAG: penicillin-binding protein 2 [Phycisphaeraceae bacterium]|nr:penicillin-binding protein 2 [Phycisphaeraceae bacterium]
MLADLKPAQPTADARRVLKVGRFMVIGISVLFAVLLGRIVQLQLAPDPRLETRVDSQHSSATLSARRGALVDRHGRMLAVSRMAYRLFLDPKMIGDRNTFSERVGYELGYDPVDVEMIMSQKPGNRYISIDQRLSEDKLARFRELKLPGVYVDPYVVRDYPYGQLAGQLIGFVGREGKGLDGLERELDPVLSGAPGRIVYARDAGGRALWIEADNYQPQHDGRPLRLSIDAMIQSIAERELAGAVEQYQAKAGQMIVMNPWTGEILAMANYPAFDPNDFSRAKPEDWRNRAVTDVFEPGSIFKPFIWSMATQLQAANPSEMIDTTTSGVWRSSKGRSLRDARGHGRIDWDHVLIESSNIGMAIVGQRLGAEKLHNIVRGFGFGQMTGSGLPGEISGVVHPLPKWTHYSVTSIPMGQELSVTPLQITRAFCAIAADGMLVHPTIYATDHRPEGQRVLTANIAAHTREVLGRAVSEGTGRKAQSDLYSLFGKTGTAQLPNFVSGGYYQDRYVSSFICGGPLEAPQLVVGCFIHEPDPSVGHYGGTVAAPAASRVIEQSLVYLGAPTSAAPEQLVQAAIHLDD